jgi:hypothetical protein
MPQPWKLRKLKMSDEVFCYIEAEQTSKRVGAVDAIFFV